MRPVYKCRNPSGLKRDGTSPIIMDNLDALVESSYEGEP